jgi:hypothetical protein
MEGTSKQEEKTAYLDAPLALDREGLDRVARLRREGLEREDKKETGRQQQPIGMSVRIETERSGWRRAGMEETYGDLGQLGFGLDAKFVVHEGEEGLGREEEERKGSAWRTRRQGGRKVVTEESRRGRKGREELTEMGLGKSLWGFRAMNWVAVRIAVGAGSEEAEEAFLEKDEEAAKARLREKVKEGMLMGRKKARRLGRRLDTKSVFERADDMRGGLCELKRKALRGGYFIPVRGGLPASLSSDLDVRLVVARPAQPSLSMDGHSDGVMIILLVGPVKRQARSREDRSSRTKERQRSGRRRCR